MSVGDVRARLFDCGSQVGIAFMLNGRRRDAYAVTRKQARELAESITEQLADTRYTHFDKIEGP